MTHINRPAETQISKAFLPDSALVREARNLVDGLDVSGYAREVARSLVGELAHNASRHAATPYTVVLSTEPTVLTVEVQDQCPELPEMRPLSVVSVSGRGLHIVDGLADEWGVTPIGTTGKTVWARVFLVIPTS